jgi:branched-chain amino acid transport system ATP-binding protein
MLTLTEIHTYYGDSHILQGVSLQVNAGETVALLGRNGAGKTTTIHSIIGLTPPRRGQILLGQRDVSRLPAHRIAQQGVALVPQGRGIFPTLTVYENMTLAAKRRTQDGWNVERVLATFPVLGQRLKNLGTQLSGGEQQMLAIARALMMNPQLLLLDEPSEGLAPLIVAEIGRIIAELRQQGLSILLVEQNLALALSLADRIYVVNKGQIVYQGTPQQLSSNDEIKHQYLGV